MAGELTNPFYPALVDPIIRELTDRGYLGVILHDSDLQELDTAPIFDGSFDGVLLTTTAMRSELPSEIERRGIPYVMVNREASSPRGHSASVPDNSQGAELVANLLVDLAHVEVGMISGPATTSTGTERLAAFRDSLARRRIALHPDAVREVPFTIEAGAQATLDMLSARPEITALFCANDVLALGSLEAASRLGRLVPADLTVVGFDDIPIVGQRVVDLTTIAVDLPALARQATSHLLQRMEDPSVAPTRAVHPVKLVLRGSHAPLSAAHAAQARAAGQVT